MRVFTRMGGHKAWLRFLNFELKWKTARVLSIWILNSLRRRLKQWGNSASQSCSSNTKKGGGKKKNTPLFSILPPNSEVAIIQYHQSRDCLDSIDWQTPMKLIHNNIFYSSRKILLIKNSQPKHNEDVLWGQKSRTKITIIKQNKKEKQEKCDRATLQLRRVCKKEELISSNDRLHPSKHLAFLSLQIHHIKQCGTSFQKSILQCRLQFTLPRLEQLNYLKRHNPLKSKQTQRQGPHLKSYRAMKQKMIHQLLTPLIHVTPIKNNNTLFCKGYQL